MADELFAGAGQMASNAASGVADAITLIVIMLAIGAFIFGVMWMLSYNKKKVILFKKTSNGMMMKTYKAKQITAKGSIKKWKLFGDWRTTELPPDECVFPDEKGRLTAVGVLLEDNIVWLQDFKIDLNSKKLTSINFEPFTAADRATLVHEYRESDNYRKKKIGEMLLAAAPIIAVVIILSVFMIFFNDTVRPSMELGDKLIAVADKMDASLSRIDQVINNRIVITDNSSIVRGLPPG